MLAAGFTHITQVMGDLAISVDLAIRPVMKMIFRLLQLSPVVEMTMLRSLAPKTVSVAAPAKFGVPPKNLIKMTPYEAQDLYGYERPARAHLELRAKQAVRAIQEGRAPDTQVILESQSVLGLIA